MAWAYKQVSVLIDTKLFGIQNELPKTKMLLSSRMATKDVWNSLHPKVREFVNRHGSKIKDLLLETYHDGSPDAIKNGMFDRYRTLWKSNGVHDYLNIPFTVGGAGHTTTIRAYVNGVLHSNFSSDPTGGNPYGWFGVGRALSPSDSDGFKMVEEFRGDSRGSLPSVLQVRPVVNVIADVVRKFDVDRQAAMVSRYGANEIADQGIQVSLNPAHPSLTGLSEYLNPLAMKALAGARHATVNNPLVIELAGTTGDPIRLTTMVSDTFKKTLGIQMAAFGFPKGVVKIKTVRPMATSAGTVSMRIRY
jgi:hypothetical protein